MYSPFHLVCLAGNFMFGTSELRSPVADKALIGVLAVMRRKILNGLEQCYIFRIANLIVLNTGSGSCQYRHRTYKHNQKVYDADSCKSCRCSNGKVMCAMRQCARPRCPGGVRPITKKGVCCPFCPTSKF